MEFWLRTKNNNDTGDAVRRPYRLLRFVIVLILATYLGVILSSALAITTMLTIPLKGNVGSFDPQYENIHFKTADGLSLSGWYVAPKNGAVILLLHTYYMDRRQVLPVAKMLVRHGYGVLLYDQRASGESDGDVRTLGWRDIPDVSLAVSWAQSQPGVEKTRIGAYGCSMGGAIALAAAAQNPALAAVAADAPSHLAFDEAMPVYDGPYWFINFPMYGMYFSFVAARAQTLPPMSTQQAAQMIAPRPLLLISTDQPGEVERVDGFYRTAGKPTSRWHIPKAGHCGGPGSHPAEYEQHLVEFFDGALLK